LEEYKQGVTLQRRKREDISQEDGGSGEEEMYDEQAFNQRYGSRSQLGAPKGMRIVKKSELKAVMRSKLDIYNILTKEG